MKLIRVGRRRINLEYLIMDEEYGTDPEPVGIPPGCIRVTLEQGKEFVLSGGDAESYRAMVEAEVIACVVDTPAPSKMGQAPPGARKD